MITLTREEAQQVLDALELHWATPPIHVREVIQTLKTRLAQPEPDIVQDAVVYGTGITKDGKRIDPASIYKAIETPRARLSAPKHWSDCAVHSEPAYPAGECDCGLVPVAWADKHDIEREGHDFYVNRQQPAKDGVPLYTKREWQGLTDEEIKEIVWNLPYEPSQEHIEAIEAKLKEKNT